MLWNDLLYRYYPKVLFYPKSDKFLEYIGAIITNYSNFMGEFIIDNPDNPKKRKIFLLLKKD